MWKDYLISMEDIEPLRALIPDYCIGDLAKGNLSGIVVMNEDSDEAPVVGVVLYRITEGQIEVEWVGATSSYDLPDQAADMVFMLARKASLSEGINGIVARFREGDVMSHCFPEPDFIWQREKSGAYSFPLSRAKILEKQKYTDMLANCIPLKSADLALKNTLVADADEKDILLPLESPIRWDAYDQEISVLYRGEGNRSEGAVLVSRESDALVLRLVYSRNFRTTIVLLEYAFDVAMKKYGPDQMIICPVVTEDSEALLKNVVPDPGSEEVIVARMETTRSGGLQ